MRSKTCILPIVTASLILHACGASSIQAPTTTPTSLAATLPASSSVVSLDQRLLAKINVAKHPLAVPGMIGNHPDEIVFAGGFIWTRTENGHLVKIDPTSNEMVGAFKVDTTTDLDNYCQGLGTDGESVWSCSAADEGDNKTINVVRVDAQTNEVVETVKVGKIFEQFEMPFLANQIWVLSGRGEKLVGIDVTSNEPGPAIDLGTRCFQLAVAENSLLATCTLDNLVLRIDPEKREVITRATVMNPRNIAAAKNGIWVTQDNGIVRLDPMSLEPVLTLTGLSGLGSTGDIFATEEAVWIRLENGFLYKIDPATNQLIEQVKPDQDLTGGSVLITSDSVWTTAIDDDLLIRLSLK